MEDFRNLLREYITEYIANRKPTIPEVIDRFKAYHADHIVWGSLHVVLEDWNVADTHVQGAIETAQHAGDVEGEALARILLKMSKTQRSKLARLA